MGATVSRAYRRNLWGDQNVAPSQLADTELFDFAGLTQGELVIDESKHIEIESLIQAINV